MARVPLDPFLPVFHRAIEKEGIDVEVLSLRSGVDYEVLQKLLTGTRAKTVDFDVADRLVCALGLVHLWRERTPWREIYLRVDLSEPDEPLIGTERRCAAPGCGNVFSVPEPTTPDATTRRGYARKIYCSTSCAQRAAKIRVGASPAPGDGRNYKCRNGHKRTPENTEYLSNGTRRCRDCNRERTQEFRKRQRALKAAA